MTNVLEKGLRSRAWCEDGKESCGIRKEQVLSASQAFSA